MVKVEDRDEHFDVSLYLLSLDCCISLEEEKAKNTCPSWPSHNDAKRGEINGPGHLTSQLSSETLYCFRVSIASSLYDSHTDRQS